MQFILYLYNFMCIYTTLCVYIQLYVYICNLYCIYTTTLQDTNQTPILEI